MNKKLLIKEITIKSIIVGIMLVMLILSFLFAGKIEKFLNINTPYSKNETSASKILDSSYYVSYIDVGQGNSTFIKLPDGKNVLIDGGNTMYGEKVVDYLKDQNVESIDYMIATHGDSDHIGGLINVLSEFEVKNIYRPFQIAGTGTSTETFQVYEDEDLKDVYLNIVQTEGRNNKVSRVTTNVYKNFITSIYSETFVEDNVVNESKVTVFYDGLKILGSDYCFEFFAPEIRSGVYKLENFSRTYGYATKGYGVNESNGNSSIFLFSCFNDTYLFTGDAPFSSSSGSSASYEELDFVKYLTLDERVLLSNVTVYLVGHHGSSYSSGEELLKLIRPKFAVISVGEDNTYGHPSSDVLKRLEKYNSGELDYLLRTDLNGTITFGLVDGKIKYSLEITKNLEKYQITWYLLGSIIFVSLSLVVVFVKVDKTKKI